MSPVTRAFDVARDTGTGRQKIETVSIETPDAGVSRGLAVVGVLEESFDHADFTDGGAAAGTIQFTGSLPAGAVVLGTKILVPEGFAGDTSAVVTIGDGTDVDRYMTGTPDVFSTAAAGVEAGVPSGSKLLTAANQPTITVTSDADWGSVTAGQLTVSIYYIQT